MILSGLICRLGRPAAGPRAAATPPIARPLDSGELAGLDRLTAWPTRRLRWDLASPTPGGPRSAAH